jgi:ATP-dependent DNA ligase
MTYKSILENAKYKPTSQAPFGSAEYIGEPKYDGLRAKIIKKGSDVHVKSRYGNDITKEFPELVEAAKRQIRGDATLDGEITMPGKRFEDLISKLKSIKHTKHAKVKYQAFDILSKNNKSQENKELMERKPLVKSTIRTGSVIKVTPYKNKPTIYDYRDALKKGYEGMVLKRKTSKYKPGKRTTDWIKARRSKPLDAKVVGLSETPKGKMSFKLVDRKGKSLGLVSSAHLTTMKRNLLIDEIKHGRKPWVEIEMREKTRAGKIRHPRIVRVRADLR